MSLKIIFNPFTGKFQYINVATSNVVIPELTSDPVSPTSEEAWVLYSGTIPAGTPMGLLLSLTYATPTTGTYQFSYRTLEGTTKRVALT